MTKSKKKKDSLVWLEELVESAKRWRAALDGASLLMSRQAQHDEAHSLNLVKLADAVDGYQKAIKEEVEAEEKDEVM